MIKCPHCGHEYSDDDTHRAENDLWAIAPNEKTVSETCPSCGKEFWIEGGYKPYYNTRKNEELL